MAELAILIFGMLFVVLFIGTLYGSTAIADRLLLSRLDLGTQRGILLLIVLVLPVLFISLAAGPFYSLYLAVKAIRKMPWS